MRGGVGEKSLRSIVELSGRVSDRALPQDRDAIGKLAGDVTSMTDALCELRSSGQVRSGSCHRKIFFFILVDGSAF